MSIIEKLGITPDKWEMMLCSSKEWAVRSKGGILFKFWKPTKFTDQFERYESEINESFNNARLVTCAPEMLDWMIRDLIIQDIMAGVLPNGLREKTEEKFGKEVADWIEVMKPKQKEVIEKATGKSWEEIKQLL